MNTCTKTTIIADNDAIVEHTENLITKRPNREVTFIPAPGHNFQVFNHLDKECGTWLPRLFCVRCGVTKELDTL